MSTDTKRTTPPTAPIDPHERWSGHLDEYVGDAINACDNCGSEQLDGWITEGALGLYSVCPNCGAEREEDA
jgi:hypothetical protein